jgi:predicted nucleic acid-binding protein
LFLNAGCVDFEESHAERAAALFNGTGRIRRLKFDCLIAASALVAGAELATRNLEDFRVFLPHGLRLANSA